ncbi:MAG: cation:proton antiporter [Acidobacteria bacterium]|jgi:Kef-type K+ transport system membrane component KefB|nr:cation:proton antiporter [Acidobacteriota bacterium]
MPTVSLPSWISNEVGYVGLLFTLFVLPRFLQRFGIPSALTAFAFGAGAGLGLGLFRSDPTVELLSTLGIVALFLFAGLDVEVGELRREVRVLAEHVSVRVVAIASLAVVATRFMGIDSRQSLLVALALLTPSTGFILDSLGGWGLSEKERFWIRSKAIATELVALVILFVVLQSTSVARLGLSALALIVMIAVLPLVFRWLAQVVIPHAPKSEFGLLMMVAVACAMITRNLGVYYLVGAFVVGMAAQRFRSALPSLASAKMLGAVESFASLFVPFYFFHAGLALEPDIFTLPSLWLGLAFVGLVLPVRLGLVSLHRWFRFRELMGAGLRVGLPMLPTIVFTLVIVEILRTEFSTPPYIRGALVIYAIVNTMAPSVWLRSPTPEFEDELQRGPDFGRLKQEESELS